MHLYIPYALMTRTQQLTHHGSFRSVNKKPISLRGTETLECLSCINHLFFIHYEKPINEFICSMEDALHLFIYVFSIYLRSSRDL